MLDASNQELIIVIFSVFSILFGVLNAYLVLKIPVLRVAENGTDLDDNKVADDEGAAIMNSIPDDKLKTMAEIAKLISDGSDTFLKTEFISIAVFTAIFAIVIALVAEIAPGTFYVTAAFLLGAATSLASGYIGMWISVRANVRTAKAAN